MAAQSADTHASELHCMPEVVHVQIVHPSSSVRPAPRSNVAPFHVQVPSRPLVDEPAVPPEPDEPAVPPKPGEPAVPPEPDVPLKPSAFSSSCRTDWPPQAKTMAAATSISRIRFHRSTGAILPSA